MEAVLFLLFGGTAFGAAIVVISVRNPFYSVVALILHLFSLGVVFLLLHAQFLAVAQIIVYAGAVMVLYLFVAAYVGGVEEEPRPQAPLLAFAPVFVVAVGAMLIVALLGTGLQAVDSRGAELGPGFGTPGQMGELLLTRFLLPFEAASYLLLIAAVAAVVLAQRRRGLENVVEGLEPAQPYPAAMAPAPEDIGSANAPLAPAGPRDVTPREAAEEGH